MRRQRPLPATRTAALAAVVSLLAAAPAALAAPHIDGSALNVPAITQLQRVGVAIVGAQSRESIAARDFAAKSLVRAGHAVVGLATFRSDPPAAWLTAASTDHDLDAVALVRISTDEAGWRVNVDIRDTAGERIVVSVGERTKHDTLIGGEEQVPVYATFAFAMSPADVEAQQQAREQEGLVPAQPPAPAARSTQPHLSVSEKVTMFGPAELRGAEFYRVVGRPDLAASYEHNRSSIRTVRGFGYTALGIGGTTLVLALAVAAATPFACAVPNTVDAVNNKPASCGNDTGELFLIPLAFTATGAVLLASAATMKVDPLSLPERRALAREYNARVDGAADEAAEQAPVAAHPAHQVQLAVSGGALPRGDGGVMLLTGRF